MMRSYWKRGEPCVWGAGAALSIILLITITLIAVVIANGMGVFWPSRVARIALTDGSVLMGEIMQRQRVPDTDRQRMRIKVGNRDLYGMDFRWIDDASVREITYPPDAVVLERAEYGNFYGFLKAVGDPRRPDALLPGDPMATYRALRVEVDAGERRLARLAGRIADVNRTLDRLRLRRLKLLYRGAGTNDAAIVELADRAQLATADFTTLAAEQVSAVTTARLYRAVFADASGAEKVLRMREIVRFITPNSMSLPAKLRHYVAKLGELLWDEPRESNTEGGLFPAIYGTVTMVFLMSILSFPFGLLAGIYLREYAREGWLLRLVRIAVNNLAGIPSIVFGVFGLGFFVYGLGGSIDRLFFAERLPTPTFGTGGILWASLTLGLLTVPVVIVATEEALGAVPRGMREASLSLGATKLQTLLRVLLPMASPGILTGFILAMARAAGEVAPLMITGVVKLAPSLPFDGQFPFVHFDRKFMHLGFHIYDIGFQSPNVEAAKPMVFVTTLLLVLIVLLMTSTAIRLRNRMKKRYSIRGL
jgi:phosphate transport system permease protein